MNAEVGQSLGTTSPSEAAGILEVLQDHLHIVLGTSPLAWNSLPRPLLDSLRRKERSHPSWSLGSCVILLEKAAEKCLIIKKLSPGTQNEYRSTVTKWLTWGQGADVERIERHHIRDFLDWVHEKAAHDGGARRSNRSAM
jgi:hypothetical protein